LRNPATISPIAMPVEVTMPLLELPPIRAHWGGRALIRNRREGTGANRLALSGAERQRRLRWIALVFGPIAAIASLGWGRPVSAAPEAMTFGAPIVLSARGQRLKVAVPVNEASGERASAAAFMVEETVAAPGHDAPAARGFTVIRPARSAYVVFQSGQIVDSPAVSVKFTVAGDPKSPYLMDLAIPEAEFGRLIPLAKVASAGRDAGVSGIGFRRIAGPAPRTDLPPK
jgi:hypothetical protein